MASATELTTGSTRLGLHHANVSRTSRTVALGIVLLMIVPFLPASSAFLFPSTVLFALRLFHRPLTAYSTAIAALSTTYSEGQQGSSSFVPLPLEDAILNRYACKRFRRYNEKVDDTDNGTSTNTASTSDPIVVNQARHCLSLARRTPTAFNLQPYQVVLVSSAEQKLALSRFCLGPNAQRVRDSDCTAIFLADRQVLRTMPRWQQLLHQKSITTSSTAAAATTTATADNCEAPAERRKRQRAWLTVRFYIALFSSGYPLPRCLAAVLSFAVRTAVSFVNVFASRWFNFPLPTLGSAETWASKQASMVAMTYMLACSSLGLATLPMEGTCVSVCLINGN
jgi:nitroreductase